MSTLDQLWSEFNKRYSRHPVWLPGVSTLQVGDVGVIDKRGWTRLYNLKKDFGIDYSSSALQDVDANYEVNSEYATTVPLEVSAKTAEVLGPLAAAGLNFKASFQRTGAFVLRAYSVSGKGIDDIGHVDERIAARDARQRFWDRKWIYVTEVVTAAPIVMLVSRGSNASATVRASADIVQGAVAKAAVEVGATAGPNIDQAFASARSSPFMWRGRWRGRWFSKLLRDLGKGGDEVPIGVLSSERIDDEESEEFGRFNSPELFSMSREDLNRSEDQA